ncbi:phosphatidylserine decarboxylase [Shewanella sp. 202IG2-18]|nr:phosphatidylserine decarboxylase [Parashewanella hymeniacidonis]
MLDRINPVFAVQLIGRLPTAVQETYLNELSEGKRIWVENLLANTDTKDVDEIEASRPDLVVEAKDYSGKSNRAKALVQRVALKKPITKIAGRVARVERGWFKNSFINWYIRKYNINMEEALKKNPEDYPTFNDFFCRRLEPGARPICMQPNVLTHPVDGTVSQAGAINQGQIIQAKNHDYSAQELLGGDERVSKPFENGKFATIYLSPSDYHRVHMPIDGTLKKMIYVSGDHYSVNPNTAAHVKKLFARNERVVCIFDTPIGEMAMVMVGATIVSSVQPVWESKPVTAKKGEKVSVWEYDTTGPNAFSLKKGEEMGHFKLGSTVVVCLENGNFGDFLKTVQPGMKTQMGTAFGYSVKKMVQDASSISFHSQENSNLEPALNPA